MQRRTFIRNSFFTLACPMLLVACGRDAKLQTIPAGKTVLAFGDSVTFGTGAAPGEDWPSLLATKTRWSVVNAGIPGDTAEAGKDRIQSLLDEHQPALVIVEIGGNDFLRRRPVAAVKDDVRRIIQTVRQARAQVVLVGVPELSLLSVVARKASDAPLYLELGKEENIPVIRHVFSEILSRPALCADSIHPNAKGYQQMADGIYAELIELGLAPAGG